MSGQSEAAEAIAREAARRAEEQHRRQEREIQKGKPRKGN